MSVNLYLEIMNMKTAPNQVYGSVTWGIGMALMEESAIDRYKRIFSPLWRSSPPNLYTL